VSRAGQLEGSGLRAALAAHLGSEQVSRVIYGAVVGLAFVAALEAHPPEPAVMAGLLLTTALAVALAELYSDFLGTRVRLRGRPTARRRREMAEDVVAVAFGAAFPAVYFALAALDVIKPGTAFGLAKWSGLGLIAFYGYWAGRLSGSSAFVSLLFALAAGLIGAVVIGLKALVH
jgi:hypothetical protein